MLHLQRPVGGVAVLPMADLMKATKKRAEKLALAEEEAAAAAAAAAAKVSIDIIFLLFLQAQLLMLVYGLIP